MIKMRLPRTGTVRPPKRQDTGLPIGFFERADNTTHTMSEVISNAKTTDNTVLITNLSKIKLVLFYQNDNTITFTQALQNLKN